MSESLLEVRDLSCTFKTPDGAVRAVRDVSFSLQAGERVAFVGEPGSGKSVTSLALMGLLDKRVADVSGTLIFAGESYSLSDTRALAKLRGHKMAMVFQDPMSALNPFLTVERQLTEVLEVHEGLSHRAAKKKSIDMLARTGIPDPSARIKQYPHQFSGGMRQRAMVAMALLCKPKLLIADEPTTALDVTVQAQIISLLRELASDVGASVLFITHDLGVVASFAQRVLVLYAGRVVERGTVFDIFDRPSHPYTQGLLRSVPRLKSKQALYAIPGRAQHGANLPKGCAFHPRCERKQDSCESVDPESRRLSETHALRCPFDAEVA